MFKESIAKFLKLDSLMENMTGYVETRIEILKVDLKKDLSRIASKVSVLAILILTALFVLFFLSTAVALAIGQVVGIFGGFSIVGLIYLVIALVLYSKREQIEKQIEMKVKEALKQKK